MSTRLLYPINHLTINPNRYKIIEDCHANNTNWYSREDAFTSNKYYNAAAVLDDIYDEDERKTILCFIWNKPGYIRFKKTIHGASYYEKATAVTRRDVYLTELEKLKTDIDILYNMVDDLDELLAECDLDELTNEIAESEPNELTDLLITESPPSSLTNSVIIDSETPSVCLSEVSSDEILDEEDLEITALADAFDEIAESELVNEEEFSGDLIESLYAI